MSDKQGNGQSLPRYYFDLGALTASMAGSFAEVVVPQGNVASGGTDSGNPVKVGGFASSSVPVLVTQGQRANAWYGLQGAAMIGVVSGAAADGTSNSSLGVTPSSGGGLAYLGSFPFVFNGTAWDRKSKATSTSRIPSAAASTNATSAKASAGTVFVIEAMNTTASVKYLKLYNKASAPTVGTDTPVRTIALAPSNARSFIEFPSGLYFATGIAYALTGAASDADATALAAGDVVGLNIDYS